MYVCGWVCQLTAVKERCDDMKHLDLQVLQAFPENGKSRIDMLLQQEIEKDPAKIIVLDDDPTGTQTVHDISVYTGWSAQEIREGFSEQNKLFYILTNSRGLTADESEKLHRQIGENVAMVSREQRKPYLIISRSDSTLRGHYPLETEILRQTIEAAGESVDGEVLCPFFLEGGRYTYGNVHYVKQAGELVPAAETEFAQDKTFGYRHSQLPQYIEEKTDGVYRAEDVVCIPLTDLRDCAFEKIEQMLLEVDGFRKICVNAVDYYDVKVFAIALYRAMRKGKRFLFRTAASFVKVMGGIADRPLLTRQELLPGNPANGGLVVVGSHTQKTTAQLEKLLELETVESVAFDSQKVLEGDEAFYKEVDRCVSEEERIIRSGKTAVCFTCRKLLSLQEDTPESALRRSVKISDGVQNLVARLDVAPAFIVAKGGITSSDIGTKALQVRRADVMGQIKPSIPVWKTGEESRFPGIPYIIFPGNTGDEETLREVVSRLIGSDQ